MSNHFDFNDQLFNQNEALSTNDVLMEPSTGLLSSRSDAIVDSTFIYNSPMDTVAGPKLFYALLAENQAAVSCRFSSKETRLHELNTFCLNPNYWFSVGASSQDFDLLQEWHLSNTNTIKVNISVDVAHGDTIYLHSLYKLYKKQPWCQNLMSGTVATPNSANKVYLSGCTHIRVGIGPGSACTTRIVTGCGVPNLTAVFNVYKHFNDHIRSNYTPPIIIADGGIKTSADIAKYLSAGADSVMLGNLLSKTLESSSWSKNYLIYTLHILTFKLFFKNYLYKRYRGQASLSFQKEKRGFVSGTPEGVEGPIQFPQYSFDFLYSSIASALKSSLSYLGLKDLKEMNPAAVKFIKITQNSLQESKPHIYNK